MKYPINFGKYQLVDRINVGGMAEVFKARSFGIAGFQKLIAIKRILPSMAEDEEFVRMFIDEARIAVQLVHANIVAIYELGKFENQYYISMEYVPGRDLRQMLDFYRSAQRFMPQAAVAYVIGKVCQGLSYAHHKTDAAGRPLKIIHRDVSPQNVLVSYQGEVKITDFGIVKAEDRGSKTQAGVLKGKFGYMSPEQVRGMPLDFRSDIFGLGILLYEALTNQRLFVGESDFVTLEKVRNADVPNMRQFNPDIPAELEQLVMKALAKNRDERFADALDLHQALLPWLQQPDNGGFDAEQLAELMERDFANEHQNELSNLSEIAKMPLPQAQEIEQNAYQSNEYDFSAGLQDDDGTQVGSVNHGEKTMIFQSNLQLMQPQVEELSPSAAVAQSDVAAATAMSSVKPPLASRLWQTLGLSSWWWLSVALMALVGGWWFYRWYQAAYGILLVKAHPAMVELFLDGESLGKATPMKRFGVRVGRHTLLAKAPGFNEKAYRFWLKSAEPATVDVNLEPLLDDQQEAMLDITSDPPGATVKLAGVVQAATPYSMVVHDTSTPLQLEIGKLGFLPQQITVHFMPGEQSKTLHVALEAANAAGAMNAVPRVLSIQTRPAGARVELGKVDKGVTPLKLLLNNDDTTPVLLQISKPGYRRLEKSLQFGTQKQLDLQFRLQRDVSNKYVKPARHKAVGASSGQDCGGAGGKISVTTMGIFDCQVWINHVAFGVAPMFKKKAPKGHCLIEVKCPDGHAFQTVRNLSAFADEKIIIKSEDWTQ